MKYILSLQLPEVTNTSKLACMGYILYYKKLKRNNKDNWIVQRTLLQGKSRNLIAFSSSFVAVFYRILQNL